MRYLISYDLNAPNRDYQTLWNALGRMEAQRVLLSQWIVRRVGTTSADLRDRLWTFMDSNDRLLVVSLDNSDWAGRNLMTNPNTH